MKSFCSNNDIELFEPDPAERDFKNYQVYGHRFTRVNTRTPTARRKLTLANFYVCCDWLERLFPRRLSRLRLAPFATPNAAASVLPDAVDENVAFSPLGWFFPLSVLAASGAEEQADKTLRKMLRIDEICLSGLNWSDVLQFYMHTLNLLNINLLTIVNQTPKESYEVTKCFHFAAKCFFKEPGGSVALKKSMKNVIHHLAKLEVFGFTNKTESFVQANYNLFGGTRTHDYILEFIRAFNEQTSVALINVFNFSPYWRTPFSRFRTQTDKFTLESGEEINVPFMNGRDLMKYIESNVYQMVGVYMAMGRLIYFIMLPKPGFNLDDLYERIFTTDGSMEKVFDLLIGSAESDVTLKMPKLRMHFEHNLIEKMRQFGAGEELFRKDGALFGKNLFSTEGVQERQPPMSINHFQQVVHFEVEEKFLTPNNRPFMITYNDVVSTMKHSVKNPTRIVNVVRPFYFFVIDKDTHATYLCGRVTNPFSKD